jgi:hypothetical protein
MATKKASKKGMGTANSKTRKLFEPGDSPITVGGGGGGGRVVTYTLIGFRKSYYKDHPKPGKWGHKGASIDALLLYVNGILIPEQPDFKPNSVITIQCACASGTHNIVITGKDLGIDVPTECTEIPGSNTYICRGCVIMEVFVDGNSVLTSADGNCSVLVLNK